MKIGILTRAPRAYSTVRLRDAAAARGHKVRRLDTMMFSVAVRSGEPGLAYKNQWVQPLDAVIPRIGPSITFYGAAVVRQFEQMGVFTLNTSNAISVSRDRLRSLQVLSRHAIGIPATAFVRAQKDVLPAIERLGGAPVIIKLLDGPEGVGLIEADTLKVARAIIATFQSADQNVLIQKSEEKGRTLRALVVGGRVVAAMRRRGRKRAVELDAASERSAIHAAQVLGLRVAGVDLLATPGGTQVLEVSSSPGLSAIEKATGIDVADAIIRHVEDQVLFPEVDVKQRLTLEKGYGIAEFTIERDSELLGQTIAGSGLRHRDVQVLSVERAGTTVPNPKGNMDLLLGDTLLCFGKLITLKSLIPQDPGGRRRKKSPA
jgi:ribosomal protein S6--L-glutamate ligase